MAADASKTIGFGPEALWITVGVLLALCAAALLVLNLIKTWRELRKPKVAQGKSVEERLNSDNERLNDLEDVTKKQQTELLLLLRSQVEILHHMVDGNNTAALKQSQKDIEEYLITGRVRQ
jgi:heme/copper-type cytochrome/quinol oxidase subunit 1